MTYVLDEGLRPYATPSQWKKLQALAEHGSERAAAKALGIHSSGIHDAKHTVARNAAARGYSPEHDLKQPVPDGYRLRGASTLYRPDTGAAVLQWVKSERDSERWQQIQNEAYEAFAATLPKVKSIRAPKTVNESLACVYPVGDLHLGMYSWDAETGANYDISIGERLLAEATEHLIEATPACDVAVIPLLGDFLHYDSFKPLTPTSGNLLDADSRFPKMVAAAIRSSRYMIEASARRHGRVHAIVEIGNHDLACSIWLMQCLAQVYQNEPRITVDISPRFYHYFEFGKCLIGTHHGHEAKMEQLPMIMATDCPAEWGRTKFRYWYTGHVHHRKSASLIPQAQDFNGCSVESFRVLPPADAWAAQKGYRPIRDQKAVVLHKEHGEVARHTVNPFMLESSGVTCT